MTGRFEQVVRWFNRTSPWHRLKPSLSKRVPSLGDADTGCRLCDGVQGCFRMNLDLANPYERAIFLNSYEAPLVATIRSVLRGGDVFVDGGANLGLLSLIASKLVGPRGQVWAFEPAPQMVARLREHLALNAVENVEVVEMGCWDEAGEAPLFDFEGATPEGVSMGRRADRSVETTWNIRTVRIDDVVTRQPRLLKLDVEGAEWAALRGADRFFSSRPVPHVLVELKRVTAEAFGYDPLELVQWLRERGEYRMHLLTSRRRRAITVDALAELLREKPSKTHNVWFEPTDR